jgi:putative transposase
MLAQSKKTEERQWLNEVSSLPLQQSIRHLDVASRNFFQSRTGKHKRKKFGLHTFNKKINNQSAEFTKTGLSLSSNYVYLAKIGSIKPIWSINLPSAPSSAIENFKGGTSPRIYPWNQSKIENPQAHAFIRGVNLKSKI